MDRSPLANARPSPACSAAILAGGAATRLNGAVKALLEVDGATILERLMAALDRFREGLVVVRDPVPFRIPPPWRLVTDRFSGAPRCSLAGIHAALSAAGAPHVFITAGDAPLLRPALPEALIAHLRPEDDIIVPRKPDGHFEPLCAIYSRRCLPVIERRMASHEYGITAFFTEVRVRPLPLPLLFAADPHLLSFRNANTPDELAEVRALAVRLRESAGQGAVTFSSTRALRKA